MIQPSWLGTDKVFVAMGSDLPSHHDLKAIAVNDDAHPSNLSANPIIAEIPGESFHIIIGPNILWKSENY
jgi:hypothetical protein